MDLYLARSQHRSPARPKLDGLLHPQRGDFALYEPREDYSPGDLVTWELGGDVSHIGIVVDQKSPQSGRYMNVYNIGEGPKLEDVLFNWKITGHYGYFGPGSS